MTTPHAAKTANEATSAGRARKGRIISSIVAVSVSMAAASASLRAAAQIDSFGSYERNTSALIGIFYDLKQTQQRASTDGAKRYSDIIDNFIVSGFDEAQLNNYYRAPLPLYTTQLAMPVMDATSAPKAFGVEGEVQPRAWVVHYKGQVSPPADGTYRFVGNFDDLLVVAINRKVVLDGCRPDTKLTRLGWKEPADKGPKVAANELSHYGDWVELKAGNPVDIDILVGERPGGQFHGVVLYQKKGETYPVDGRGRAILPLFQVAEKKENKSQYLTDGPIWHCIE